VLIGDKGIGKTHLATVITASVLRASARGRYFNTVDLVTRLEEEARIGKAGAIAAQLGRLDLVMLDELVYLPFTRSGGQLLFRADTRNNRDVGSALTGFVFDGSSVSI